jgi:hypothetical protein
MSLPLPLNSFLKPRYHFMFAGLLSVILHGLITSLYLSHYYLQKYGTSILKISPNDWKMWEDCDRITSLSLLFYPIITFISIIIFFIINKQKKELRTGILLYILTLILVFGYIFYFSQSVVVYIMPALMIIGAISSYKGGYHEATRIFILLFLILIVAYGADKLSVKLLSSDLW